MGILFTKLINIFFSNEQYKICVLGLDNAGKTTILYKLLLGSAVETTPTIGSNVEELTYKNINLLVWDVGGQDSLRASWRLENEALTNASMLVFANKQDVQGSFGPAQISLQLGLDAIRNRQWHIQACCGLTGDGLHEVNSHIVVDRLFFNFPFRAWTG
ncbi:hypothetical protein HK099_004974 [Clydaea vesicula]|uniref:ADP-ribosylation factor n=1 Tax=Clydaea vesicula TaxID=447962 RepID=A0AAD5U6U6_9FUNG|nr:hypothetical protein HK099_004974 [Clydaea vesicula]KAJ3391027.1 hypothetical protein HDU92_000184 [Lobulomyces angularis]